MSWPVGWACGPSGFRRRQTLAQERASRTGARARLHSPPRAGLAGAPYTVPAMRTLRQDARGESGRPSPAEPGSASSWTPDGPSRPQRAWRPPARPSSGGSRG
eukprot:12633418-Alexandrium_andersonii.AAC.1